MKCPVCNSSISFEETKIAAGVIKIGYCRECDITVVECKKYREVVKGEAKLPLKMRGFGDIDLIKLIKSREASMNV